MTNRLHSIIRYSPLELEVDTCSRCEREIKGNEEQFEYKDDYICRECWEALIEDGEIKREGER